MTKLLLSLHVLAAVLTVGPIAVAASMFPALARRTLAGDRPGAASPGPAADRTISTSAPGPASDSAAVGPAVDNAAVGPAADSSAVGPAADSSAVGPAADSSAFGPAADNAAVGPAAVAAVDRPAGASALSVLHRICRVYAVLGVAVPVFGLATAGSLGVLGDPWLLTSIALTALAAAVLALLILPGQRRLLAADSPADHDHRPVLARLGMLTGVFNLLWAVVVILMIVRPGSTTGA
ncbi:membrane protein [Actinoplanes ianthinogenes]|uniref:Membrane protein n=1 Tax=Actinoplanes ianthinogenes TaxID=122358 RepID=A0ABM7LKE7_9ACTN|nr:hypothetical protein [Actinoplanes ianthinogenes]BCJ39740.1 membrane protein [Actinoplanes ianthinogenes]GGR47719.1 membrane protein [Actinoplanes ianthinogenes]